MFILGHLFLLGVGLGLDMKWAGVAKFFGPTLTIYTLVLNKKIKKIKKKNLFV